VSKRHHLPVWDEVRRHRKGAAAALARHGLDRTIGSWVFRHRFAPGPELAIVADVCIVIGGDDHSVLLRGNGRTRRVSWKTFAEHWRPWQGDPMPRPIVLGDALLWPSRKGGET